MELSPEPPQAARPRDNSLCHVFVERENVKQEQQLLLKAVRDTLVLLHEGGMVLGYKLCEETRTLFGSRLIIGRNIRESRRVVCSTACSPCFKLVLRDFTAGARLQLMTEGQVPEGCSTLWT